MLNTGWGLISACRNVFAPMEKMPFIKWFRSLPLIAIGFTIIIIYSDRFSTLMCNNIITWKFHSQAYYKERRYYHFVFFFQTTGPVERERMFLGAVSAYEPLAIQVSDQENIFSFFDLELIQQVKVYLCTDLIRLYYHSYFHLPTFSYLSLLPT